MLHRKLFFGGVLALTGLFLTGSAHADKVKVTITNLAPQNGNFLTPVWVGFHDGTFDLYDAGAPASMGLERLAEDGNTAPLSTLFHATTATGKDATLFGFNGVGGPLDPGETTMMTFTLDAMMNRYFSYASMVIPSNDAFIANGNPLAHSLFDAMGNFTGADFFVLGSQVLDAGTEVNDELPVNTAFFGQAAPDTGDEENGVVGLHPGFKPAGSGGILDDPMFANADFTQSGYQIAHITVSRVPDAIPEPGTLALAGVGLLPLLGIVRRRRR